MCAPMELYRPQPVSSASQPVDQNTPPAEAAARLRDGAVLRVTDQYKTGAEILAQLARLLPPPGPKAPYAARQAAQQAHWAAAMRLLAPISGHKLALSGAGPIGFLADLYPGMGDFYLPFPQVQDMHSAWGRYRDGVPLAVLGHEIRPFYGTYVPTRTSHLELFGTWLSQNGGNRGRAADVGTGCGVLAWMLCRAGFEDVLATDISPNAIESVTRDLRRHPAPITLHRGDLLDGTDGDFDLIVFNPPWLPGAINSPLDRALYFDSDDLFERFFAQAAARLRPNGRIVVLFSDVMSLLRPDIAHPIRAELERGNLHEVQVMRRRVKPPRGSKRRTRERVEIWELARS